MPSSFAITTATNSIPLDPNRRNQASFTVSNTSGRAVRGRGRIVPQNSAAAPWLTLAGDAERDFPISGTQQYAVQIAVPPTAPAGNYPFRLDMVGVDNPDEDLTQGPTVPLVVPEPVVVKKPFPWWILVAAALAVIILVGGFLFFRSSQQGAAG